MNKSNTWWMIEWNNHGWGLIVNKNASTQTNESLFFIHWMQLEENKQLNTLKNTYHIWKKKSM